MAAPVLEDQGESLFDAVKKMIGEKHPYEWLWEATPCGQEETYFADLVSLMGGQEAIGNKWSDTLPADVFEDGGSEMYATLAIANFRLLTSLDDNKTMTTCWRQRSAVRIFGVIERSLSDKKAANTSSEKPFLVLQPSMAGMPMSQLKFVCAHGVGSTRLMAWHVTARALVDLWRANPEMNQMQEFKRFFKSISKLNVFAGIQDAAQRSRTAMGSSS